MIEQSNDSTALPHPAARSSTTIAMATTKAAASGDRRRHASGTVSATALATLSGVTSPLISVPVKTNASFNPSRPSASATSARGSPAQKRRISTKRA